MVRTIESAGAALFEPADIRPYDNWAEPKQGLFFTFDGLYLHISPAAKTSVGDPNLTPTVFVGPALNDSFIETNSVDTSGPSIWKYGDRMELGYIDGHHGFMFTSLETNTQTNDLTYPNAFVVFNDPAFGPTGSHYLDTILRACGRRPSRRSSARRRSISRNSTCRTSPGCKASRPSTSTGRPNFP